VKIIRGADSERLAIHARSVLKGLEDYDRRHPQYAKPRDCGSYSAVFPILCDECGETFWARDQYSSHKRCNKGQPGMGFGGSS